MGIEVVNAFGNLVFGQSMVIDRLGNLRVLIPGEVAKAGEIIVSNHAITDLKKASSLEVSMFDADGNGRDISADVAKVISSLESGEDPTQLNDAFSPAAGTELSSSITDAVNVTRTLNETKVETAFTTTGFGQLGLTEQQTNTLFTQLKSVIGNSESVNFSPTGQDLVVLTDEGTQVSGKLIAADANSFDQLTFIAQELPLNGEITVDASGNWIYTPNEYFNGDDSFTVQVSDGRGGIDTITVDVTVAPVHETPVIFIPELGDDAMLNSDEAKTNLGVMVELPRGTGVGDVIELRGNNGNVVGTHTVVKEDINNGTILISVTKPIDGSHQYEAQITDPQGNQGPVSNQVDFIVDTLAPGKGVDSDTPKDNDLNNIEFIDGLINETELKAVSLTGKVETTGKIDEIIIVGKDTNGKETSYTLLDEDYTLVNGVVTVTDLDLKAKGFGDGQLTVDMTVTDQAGNTGSVDDTTVVDITAPGEGVDGDSDPANDTNSIAFADELINEQELSAVDLSGKVEENGTLESIIISGKDTNGDDKSYTLTAGDYTLENGVVMIKDLDLAAKGFGDGQLTVDMTVTDQAGNTGSVNDTTLVDITAPGEGVDGDSDPANDANSIAFADELINEQELSAVDLSGKVEENGTLESIIISGKDTNGDDKSYMLTTGDYTLANGVVTINDLDLAAKGFGDGQLTVDMKVTDLAGNTGSVNDTTQVDITAPGEGVDGDSDPANDTNSIAFADELISEQEFSAVDLSGKVEENGTLESIIISGKDTDGNDKSYTLTPDDYTLVDGVVTITDLDLAAEGFGDGELTVDMKVTDLAGNTGSVNDNTVVDTKAPGEGEGPQGANLGPVVDIKDDTNHDGLISKDELGDDQVQVEVSVNHNELTNGGHVTLTVHGGDEVQLKLVDGKLVTLTDEATSYHYDNGTIAWTESAPAEGGMITVTATQTDRAGNESAQGSDSAELDTVAPGDGAGENNSDIGPEVKIISDSDNDGWLNESEVGSADRVNVQVEVNHAELANGGYVTLTVNGGDEVQLKLNDAKDGLVLNNGEAQATYSYDKTTGTITWTETKPAEGETITVTATQTDQADNTSAQGQDSATVDTIAVGENNPDLAPKVEISSDTNNDGWLNESEVGSADNVKVQVEVNHAELANGGYVTLTINGQDVELKLNDAKDGLVLNNGEAQTTYSYDKTTGTITWTESKPAEGETITVTATQTDQADNTSAQGQDSATVDTTAIGEGEGNNGSDLGPKVLISTDTNNDGWLNESEVGSADSVNVKVEVNHAELANGGHVTLTVNGGDEVQLKLNDAKDGLVQNNGEAQATYSYDKTTGTITWTETKPAEGETITVTATQTDQAGNVSAPATDSATVDTIAVGENNPDLAPKVEISSDTNNDGWLNESEVGSVDSVNVKVEVNHDELSNGGCITLTINGQDVELKLNDAKDGLVLNNGGAQATYSYDKTTGTITWNETKPAEGEAITVTATQTDQADNTSAQGQDSATVDTTAIGEGEGNNGSDLGPRVLISSDTNNDGWLNESEVGSTDNVNVQVEVNHAELANGGYVTLTINGQDVELKLNDAKDGLVLGNGNAQTTYSYDKTTGTITWTETKPAEGETIIVTATQTDQADNTSAEGQDSATVDTTAVGDDEGINNADLGPNVEITSDSDNDGWLNESEVGSADTVNVKVEVNHNELANGGYVTLTINGEQVEVKLNDAKDGLVLGNGNAQTTYSYDKTTGTITWTETKPAEGETITVTATQTDKAGNESVQGSDSAQIDTVAPGDGAGENNNDIGPEVKIISDSDNDGWLNENEVGNADSVNVKVEVNHDELTNGGYVTLTINGQDVELKLNDAKDGLVLSNGNAQTTYSYDKTTGTITWTESKPAEGETITVTATQTDQADNTSAEGQDSATVDTTAIGEGEGNNGSDLGPKVLISSDTNKDGWLNESEVGSADNVNVQVEVNHAELANGGYVSLTVNGGDEVKLKLNDAKDGLVLNNGDAQAIYSYDKTTGTITWTESKPAEGEKITVTATQTDQADNTSAQGQDSATVGTPNNPPQAVDDGLANYTVSLGSFNGGSWTDESINITASYNGVVKDVVEKNDALGVHTFGDSISGGPETQIEYNRASGESEKLKIELGSPITSFSFTVSNLYKDEGVTGNHEQGKWVAYLGTTAVASGMFVANDGNRDGSYSISEDDLGGVAFDSIVFEATDYSVKPVDERGTDSSEYYLSGFEGKGSTSLVATQNEEFKIKLSQLLDNDSDIDGDSIRITQISESGVNADVDIKDGYVHFTSSDLGTNTFNYTITDDKGGKSEATVTVHVNPPIEAAQISQVTVYEPEVTEGDDLVFLVKLDQGVLGEAGKFDFSYGGINDTASSTDVDLSRVQFTNGVKFENGQLVVPIGVSSFSIVIPTLKDQLAEDTETYSITLNGQEVTGQIINLPPPSAESKEIVGQEDTAIILTLGDFGVRDVNAKVEIDWSTVTLGQLQIKNDDEWEILDGDSISAARIKAGDIRYMPENDDSGSNDYAAAGVGDQKNSYQEIKFEVVKDGLSSGEHTLTVDINPLADNVTVDIKLGAITQSHDKFKTWGMVYEDFLPENFDSAAFNIEAEITDSSIYQENVYGSTGEKNDYIYSKNGGSDALYGAHYNEFLLGGDDVLVGHINDKNDMRGGLGSDILVAGLGLDSIYGRDHYTNNGDGLFDIAVLQGSSSDYIHQVYKIDGLDDRVLEMKRADHDPNPLSVMTLRNIDYIQFDDGIYYIDYLNGELVAEKPIWTIAIETIKVNVTDTDGSEQLKGTIDLTGIPDGVELFINGVEQTNFVLDNGIKTYTLDLTLADPFSGEITGAELKVPSSYQGELDFDLSVTATSQEVANGSEQSSTSIANVTVGSDIGEKLTGSSGDDLLSAQEGNDELEGGAGKDTLIGGIGNDILIGGDDQDVFKFVDQGDGIRDGETDTIKDFIRGEDILDFSEILESGNDNVDDLLQFVASKQGDDIKVTISDGTSEHDVVLEDSANQFREHINGDVVDSTAILQDLLNLPD